MKKLLIIATIAASFGVKTQIQALVKTNVYLINNSGKNAQVGKVKITELGKLRYPIRDKVIQFPRTIKDNEKVILFSIDRDQNIGEMFWTTNYTLIRTTVNDMSLQATSQVDGANFLKSKFSMFYSFPKKPGQAGYVTFPIFEKNGIRIIEKSKPLTAYKDIYIQLY
ncbi:hypothetical protein KAH94_04020 [bacterium]|nr:hypothetical protein [bacterium]